MMKTNHYLKNRSTVSASLDESRDIILGFDIGGTKTAIVLGTTKGEILGRVEIPTNSSAPFSTSFDKIVAAADCFLGKKKYSKYKPRLISVSIGGPLDIDRGIIFSPPHLPNWKNAPVKDMLVDHYHLPVFVEHDGNAGALSEQYYGAAKGVNNLIYLTMGTGLGAGLILNGDIYRGTNDLAGEIGHIRLSKEGPIEYDKPGSWESFCSASGLARLANLRNPKKWPIGTIPQQIIKQAMSGDADAVELIDEVGRWLGKGIAYLVDTLNPQLVLVGTLGILLGDLLLEPTRKIVKREALPRASKVCKILPAHLGDKLSSYCAIIAGVHASKLGYRSIDKSLNGNDTLSIVVGSLGAGLSVREKTIRLLSTQIAETADVITATLVNGCKILVFGNGGSAAAAQHLVGELVGRYKAERNGLPAVALTADSSVLTCIGNDYSFSDVYSRQVDALASPGDLVIGISTSGQSNNVVKGLKSAKVKGASTIALTGEQGLKLPIADHELAIPSLQTARVQEEHDAIIHAWCEIVDKRFQIGIPAVE